MTVRVRAVGDDLAAARLERFAARARAPRDAFRGPVLDDVLAVQRQFWATRGRRTWAPRDPDTRKRHGGQLMDVTGRLRRVASSPQRRVQGRTTRASNRGLRFGVGETGRTRYGRDVAMRRRNARGLVADPDARDALRYADSLAAWLERA